MAHPLDEQFRDGRRYDSEEDDNIIMPAKRSRYDTSSEDEDEDYDASAEEDEDDDARADENEDEDASAEEDEDDDARADENEDDDASADEDEDDDASAASPPKRNHLAQLMIDHQLLTAICTLQLDLVKTLIALGASLTGMKPYQREFPPLFTICTLKPTPNRKSIHIAIINELIKNGASVNLKNSRQQTPLHGACTTNAVQVLLQNGASVYEVDELGETPLFVACKRKRSTDLITALLEAGAINSMNTSRAKCSPLHVASYSVMKLLLQKGANANGQGEDESPLFTHCRKSACPYDAITSLLEHGASINYQSQKGRTPLHAASLSAVKETVKFLLQKGAFVNEVDNEGESPLFMAAKKIVVTDDVISILLKHGASINMKNSKGRTPLHVCHNSATVLIQNGASVNERDNEGESPLFIACRGRSWCGNAATLLRYGASVNLKNNEGDTPLHVACYNYHMDVISLLLRKGASVNEANNVGETPLFVVIKRNAHPENLITILLAHGALIDKKNIKGKTPLHVACSKRAIGVISALLEHGAASVNEANIFGRMPLEYTDRESAPIVLDYGASHCDNRSGCWLYTDCRFSRQHCDITNHIAKTKAAAVIAVHNPTSIFGPELTTMKSSMIGQSNISYFDLLHLNIPRSGYEEVLSTVTPTLLKNSFPQFANMIYRSCLEIKKIHLMDKCSGFFTLTDLPFLPSELVYKVLENMGFADLVILNQVIRPVQQRINSGSA